MLPPKTLHIALVTTFNYGTGDAIVAMAKESVEAINKDVGANSLLPGSTLVLKMFDTGGSGSPEMQARYKDLVQSTSTE